MDLQLTPVFYAHVGTTSPNCMKVLPTTRRGSQKVAIGDHDGVLTCFGMKKGDAQMVFKTLPGPAISHLQLSGAPGAIPERIFVSAGTQVKAFTKKGKQFLSFDSNLAEPIRNMWVDHSHLFITGSNLYNHYVNCQDTDYFISDERINAVLALPLSSAEPSSTSHSLTGSPVPVLGCQDGSLRVLKGSELLYELEVAGVPVSLALCDGDGGDSGTEVFYGTQDGKLGLIKISKDEPEYCWDMVNEHRYGGISSISSYDVTGDGSKEILLGRDDGVVEVYSVDETCQPRIQFTHVFPESVTGVCGGVIGSSSGQGEVLVSTYTGQVYGLSRGHAGHAGKGKVSSEVLTRIDSLRQEVGKLEGQLSSARDQYLSMVQSATDGSFTALPEFAINDKFVLNQDEAWYTLSIETQTCLELVVLQCNVPVDLQQVDKSSAVISYTTDTENGNFLLASLRCSDTNRLEVKVRSIEGQYGVLQAYITPKMEPSSSRLRQYQIKPLSLHQRIHDFDSTLPCNQLTVTGRFSFSEIHSWVSYCLPDVPERPQEEEEKLVIQFRSSFTGTQLECQYQAGHAVFRSDNLSTISVLKEVLSKEATKKNVSIKLSHELDESSVPHILKLLFPKLERQLMLAKSVQVIDALQEIKIHEEDVSFLHPQWLYILDNAEGFREEFKSQPAMFERLEALVTDLFMDRAAFKGDLTAKEKLPELLTILENGEDLETLNQFFELQ